MCVFCVARDKFCVNRDRFCVQRDKFCVLCDGFCVWRQGKCCLDWTYENAFCVKVWRTSEDFGKPQCEPGEKPGVLRTRFGCGYRRKPRSNRHLSTFRRGRQTGRSTHPVCGLRHCFGCRVSGVELRAIRSSGIFFPGVHVD